MYDFPLSLLFERREFVGHELVAAGLPEEFAVARETVGADVAASERGFDGAALLTLMGAIAEPAGGGGPGDLVEGHVDALLAGPQLELAHTGSVDERAAAR